MLSFTIGLVVGWLIGVIMTAFLLAKKNLERMKRVEDAVEEKVGLAKATYNYYNMTPEERAAKEKADAELEQEENKADNTADTPSE